MARRQICLSSELDDGGQGVRFQVVADGEVQPAFVVRHGGQARAYVNRCRHIGLELDIARGRFFDNRGEHLICATHGALYDPLTGACVAGPCSGVGLMKIPIVELDGVVCMADNCGYQMIDTQTG